MQQPNGSIEDNARSRNATRSYSSHHERQWAEVAAIRAIYSLEFEELAYPWKIAEHPPLFVLHLSIGEAGAPSLPAPAGGNADRGGKAVPVVVAAVDVEFKMGRLYPDEVPEISVARRKGCSQGQAESLGALLAQKARELTGYEMVFDLAELAKVHLGIS